MSKKIRFMTSAGETGLTFQSGSKLLDGQTLRSVRQLTPQSASLLDQLLRDPPGASLRVPGLNDSLPPRKYVEGATCQITVNAYERDRRARAACIAHYGCKCSACGFDFEKVYGKIGCGVIHVHHLKPLSTIRKAYRVDPVKDLRPVCPNCHAMLHAISPEMTIEDLVQMLRKNH